jgi:hypothetical protein
MVGSPRNVPVGVGTVPESLAQCNRSVVEPENIRADFLLEARIFRESKLGHSVPTPTVARTV